MKATQQLHDLGQSRGWTTSRANSWRAAHFAGTETSYQLRD